MATESDAVDVVAGAGSGAGAGSAAVATSGDACGCGAVPSPAETALLTPVLTDDAASTAEAAALAGGGTHALRPADHQLIKHCYAIRDAMRAPMHSMFRVVAILTVTVSGGGDGPKLRHVVGTNHEIGVIGGSICAERTALGKLQLMDYDALVAVHIVTDSPDPITPGTLCRQYMSEVGPANTRVVVDADNGCTITTLGELYPYPYLYAGQARADVVKYAKAFRARCAPVEESLSDAEGSMYTQCLAMVSDTNAAAHRDGLHPIRFSGGVLFDDGSIEVTWLSKALEYGATVGVFAKLLHTLETKARARVQPSVAIQVDQFGVAHSPTGQDRALLSEFGFGSCAVLLHAAPPAGSDQAPSLVRTAVSALVPMTPAVEACLGGK